MSADSISLDPSSFSAHTTVQTPSGVPYEAVAEKRAGHWGREQPKHIHDSPSPQKGAEYTHTAFYLYSDSADCVYEKGRRVYRYGIGCKHAGVWSTQIPPVRGEVYGVDWEALADDRIEDYQNPEGEGSSSWIGRSWTSPTSE